MNNISWPSVFGAVWLALAFVTAAGGAAKENWYVIGMSGVWAVCGIGLVLLSMREDR